MNPQVVAAIIAAAGALGGKIVDFWHHDGGSAADQQERHKVDAAAADAVLKHYEQLKNGVTNNSMKIIRYLENGEQRRSKEIWKKVFGELEEPEEFSYRLKYLETVGLIREGHREYRITPLGKAFLDHARKTKDYYGIVFD